jgi:hypothetical protein
MNSQQVLPGAKIASEAQALRDPCDDFALDCLVPFVWVARRLVGIAYVPGKGGPRICLPHSILGARAILQASPA